MSSKYNFLGIYNYSSGHVKFGYNKSPVDMNNDPLFVLKFLILIHYTGRMEVYQVILLYMYICLYGHFCLSVVDLSTI